MFSTENPINVTEVPVIETDEDWGFTKAETVGINLGLVPRQKSSLHFFGISLRPTSRALPWLAGLHQLTRVSLTR